MDDSKENIGLLRSLNQILAVGNILSAIPVDIRLCQFLYTEMKSITGVEACTVCLYSLKEPYGDQILKSCGKCGFLDTQQQCMNLQVSHKDIIILPLATLNANYAYIALKINNDFLQLLVPALRNLCNISAITIENKIQKKNLEELNSELLLQKGLLEKKVLDRTADLNESNQKLSIINSDLIKAIEKAEENDKLKTAFLHNISHEIRTPMNAIIGFSSLLDEPDIDSETRSSFIETIQNSSNQLLSIINDIVDISNIEANLAIAKISSFDLNLALDELYNQFLPEVQKKDLHLILAKAISDNEVIIETDWIKLNQIFSNLLNNAIKFTDRGEIKFGYDIKSNLIEFYVSDTGIGIAAEEQELIFDRFYKIENTLSRKFEGTGLGLSISKGYVELLGGKIWLRSGPGTGSVFYFTIPFVHSNKSILSEQQFFNLAETVIFKKKTILIAEDDDNNFELIFFLLNGLDAEIIRACNGKDAVEICRNSKNIDLVIMDIKMPGMDGYKATEQIRQFLPDLPVLIQTAYVDDQKKAFESGSTDFIGKPFNKEQFLSKIIELLKKV